MYGYSDYAYHTNDFTPDYACDPTYCNTINDIPSPSNSVPYAEDNKCDDQDFQKEAITQKPR